MTPNNQRPEKKRIRIAFSEDICVCCGAPVPEGRQICWACEHGENIKDRDAEDE